MAPLGKGGMGMVWKAWDSRLRRVVALKQILPHGKENAALLERFLREARLAAKLSHPGIVQVHDVGEHEGQHYLTCDYIEGKPLSEVMRAPVAPAKAAGWARQIAEALANRALAREDKGDLDGAMDDYQRALEVAAPDWPHRAAVEGMLARVCQRPGIPRPDR